MPEELGFNDDIDDYHNYHHYVTIIIKTLAVGETLTSLIRHHDPDSESDTDLDSDADPDLDSCFEHANFHIHVLRWCFDLYIYMSIYIYHS